MAQDNQQAQSPAPAPAPAKKPFYAQNWFIIISLLFCFPLGLILMWAKSSWGTGAKVGVTIVWGFLVVIGLASNPQPTTQTPAPAQTAAKSAPAVAPATKKVAPPAATPEEKKIGLKTPFRLGDFTYTVDSIQTKKSIGNQFVNHKAQEGATLLIVKYTLANEANETKTVLADDFILRDFKGREFRPSSEAATAYAMSGGSKDLLLGEVQPGLKRKMTSVYEIPLESTQKTGLILVIPEKGMFSSGKVEVNLK